MIEQQVAQPWNLGTVSIAVDQAELTQVMRMVAYEIDVSISIPELDDLYLVTADYNAKPAQTVIEDLAKRAGLVAEYDGEIITFVTQDNALKDFVVVRAGYAQTQEVVKTMQNMLGQKATVDQIDDRIIISGDNRVLQQATKLAQHFETGNDGWLLDVRVVSITETFKRELGVDWNIEANVGLNTTGSGVLTNADLIVNAIGKAVDTGTNASLLQTATLYVLEGSTSTINQGQRVPVPRFSTSPEGTTTTVGYDYITAGFSLEAGAKRVPTGAQLNLRPKISSVLGFVRDAPITQESTVDLTVIVESGDWLVISGLEASRSANDVKNIPGLTAPIFGSNMTNQDTSNLLVLVHAERIYQAQ